MNGLKQIAAFLLIWLTAFPVLAVVAEPPFLSVIQKEKQNQLIFAWMQPVDFTEEVQDNRYRLTFPVRLSSKIRSLEQIRAGLPEKWRQISFDEEGESLTFSVVLPPNGAVNAVKEGRIIRVSLTEGKQPVNTKTESAKTEKTVPSAPLPPSPPSTAKTVPAPLPATESVVSASPSSPVSAPTEAITSKEAPSVSSEEKSESEKQAENVSSQEEVIDDKEDISPMDEVELKRLDKSLPYQEEKPNVSLELHDKKAIAEQERQDRLSGFSYRAATLGFPWTRMTGCAAFRRDGYLWLVFDRLGDFDFSLERELYKDIILEMVQIPHSHATIYRMVLAQGYNPSLRREGFLWIVDFMYQPIRPRRPINLVLQRKTAFGPRIFVPLEEAPLVLPMIDPEVGDLMYIVPVFAKGAGIDKTRLFVDATFPQTAQGMLVLPNTEGTTVYTSSAGVEIRGPKGGMRFSPEDVLTFLSQTKTDSHPLAQVLDVSAWGVNNLGNYYTSLKKFQNDVLQAEPKDKSVPRLTLARYYFVNGMYPETLSTLRTLAGDDKKAAEAPGVIALRGASNFMMKRYEEAIEDFSHPVIQKDVASKFWKAAASAAISHTPGKYIQEIKDNMVVLQTYPQSIKTPLSLIALRSAVSAKDENGVQNFVEAAESSDNTPAQNDEIIYYRALWQEEKRVYSVAQEEMKFLSEGKNLYIRAIAGLERTRMEAKANIIKPKQRIEELERLSYAWRGGEFEYNVMTMLMKEFESQKNYVQVLYVLKDMRSRFGDTPDKEKIQKLMEEVFQKIYLSDNDNDISAVKAAALYEDFKELTPPGEKGAQIARKLADRLVTIDLLDRAAGLLEEQINQPVSDKEKGLLSTRLALVRLLNKEPQKALNALKISENKRFSDKLKKQRLYIQAKALADMKKIDEAAALLEEDNSDEAKSLLAEIFWQAQMWDKAADALKGLIKKPQPKVPLTQQEAQRILDWAAALRLAGRSKVVTRVRENFLPYMKETNLAQAFDFITKTPQQGLLDYHEVAKEVESAESFNSFAKEYTNRLKTEGLSETVR